MTHPDVRAAGGPCCAHRRVVANPWDNDDGTKSDRWECELCGWLFLPALDRARPSSPDPEASVGEAKPSWLETIVRRLDALERGDAKIGIPGSSAPSPAPPASAICTGCEDRIADSDYHSCVPSEPGSATNVPQRMGRGAPPASATPTAEERAQAILLDIFQGDSSAYPNLRVQIAQQIRSAERAARERAIRECAKLIQDYCLAHHHPISEPRSLSMKYVGMLRALLAPEKEA